MADVPELVFAITAHHPMKCIFAVQHSAGFTVDLLIATEDGYV